MPVIFGPEPLDSLDMQILETISKHGRSGQSFNKLVLEVNGFAARSTFALRVKRLEKLNYAESVPDAKKRQVRRIRGKPTTLLVMRIASRMKAQCSELEQAINSRAESIRAKKDHLSLISARPKSKTRRSSLTKLTTRPRASSASSECMR